MSSVLTCPSLRLGNSPGGRGKGVVVGVGWARSRGPPHVYLAGGAWSGSGPRPRPRRAGGQSQRGRVSTAARAPRPNPRRPPAPCPRPPPSRTGDRAPDPLRPDCSPGSGGPFTPLSAPTSRRAFPIRSPPPSPPRRRQGPVLVPEAVVSAAAHSRLKGLEGGRGAFASPFTFSFASPLGREPVSGPSCGRRP